MKLEYSKHWLKKRKYRADIIDDMVLYSIQNSAQIRDKYWEDALNAIAKIPPSGRTLKVVYKRVKNGKIKVISAFWLD